MATKGNYQVRCWDAFWNDFVMIPMSFDNREEAIQACIDESAYHDCGRDGTCEMQVWVECMGGTAYQMVGYAEYTETLIDELGLTECDFEFVECFC